jgi:aminopeptidase
MEMSDFYARYAAIALEVGCNVQPGQEVYVRVPIDAAGLVPHLVRGAYDRGALFVHVEYRDQRAIRARMEYAPEETLSFVPPGVLGERLRVAKTGGASLAVLGEDPMGLTGVPPERRGPIVKAYAEATSEIRALTMSDFYPWCVISMPNPSWAARVYPDLSPDEALARLTEAVAHACRLDTDDPVGAWRDHSRRLMRLASWLTEKAFDRFEYAAPGTELSVGMPADQNWIGTEGISANGVTFIANMPTDEVFCAPDWRRVEGVVRSSRPLVLGGTNVGHAEFVIEAGRITGASSESDQAILDQELDLDERSRYLGEIALVSEDAPVASLATTFYDGLYDENAGCHFAFGNAYTNCVHGGSNMTDDEKQAAGLNVSQQHVDFTVGSADLAITGITGAGERMTIMSNGLWSDELVQATGL